MTFSQWFFGGIDNPYQAGQWKPLHICVMLSCVALIVLFALVVKKAQNKDRVRKIILYALVGAIFFFEIASRVMYAVKLYYLHQPEMEGLTWYWILLPKPWCAIACWTLMASVFVNKPFFYNFASLSALLCSVVYFVYPGVGFNNVYLLFDNWYSILTHSLLLITSVTLMTTGFASFRYKDIWKEGICLAAVVAYSLVEIFILKVQPDPMYFMPGGDIQANILRLPYGVYLTAYIAVVVLVFNIPHLLADRQSVKAFFAKRKKIPVEK